MTHRRGHRLSPDRHRGTGTCRGGWGSSPEGVREVSDGRKSLHELKYEVEELILGGGGGEGGAHEEMNLNDRQQRPQRRQLTSKQLVLHLVLPASAATTTSSQCRCTTDMVQTLIDRDVRRSVWTRTRGDSMAEVEYVKS